MAADTRTAVSALARLPPLTVGTIALSLLGLPLFVLALGAFDASVPPAVSIGVFWALAAVVLGVAVGVEDLSLADVGFRRPGWVDLGYLLGTSVAVLLVYVLTDPLVSTLGLPVADDAGAVSAGAGIGVAIARAVTIGVVEEILYRGYPIERLLEYTDSPLVAGAVTWGVFTLAHVPRWPLGNLVQTALVAGVLTLVYLRRRTLVPVVGAHVLVWVFAALGQVYG
jgi:hypothetical protein